MAVHIALLNDLRSIESKAQKDYKIPMLLLMEQAGAAVAKRAATLIHGKQDCRVLFLCGTGNNGGDALAAARHMVAEGIKVCVFMYGDHKEASPLTRMYAGILERTGIAIRDLRDDAVLSEFVECIHACDLIVDGLMGIGFSPPLNSGIGRIIEMVNESKSSVIAIDVPSGVECDTGKADTAVSAEETVALILPKPAHYLSPGAIHCGRVVVERLALPDELIQDCSHTKVLDAQAASALLMERKMDSHKGDFGKTVIVAGSKLYPGAAVLAAKGAVRAGAGLVYLINYGRKDISGMMPEVLPTEGLLDGKYCAVRDHVLKTVEKIGDVSALVMGPGLTQDPRIGEAVQNAALSWAGPLILDADALNVFVGKTELLQRIKGPLILTPHPGEMARLMGISIREIQDDRLQVTREASAQWKCTVLLKGAGTVVSTAEGRAYINTTGNPGMAVGGSGDVLAGLVGGLVSQGYSAEVSAVLGAYVHGCAGDIAASEIGSVGYTPSDLAERIPKAFRCLNHYRYAGKFVPVGEENTAAANEKEVI